jgi:hypothetical protein
VVYYCVLEVLTIPDVQYPITLFLSALASMIVPKQRDLAGRLYLVGIPMQRPRSRIICISTVYVIVHFEFLLLLAFRIAVAKLTDPVCLSSPRLVYR